MDNINESDSIVENSNEGDFFENAIYNIIGEPESQEEMSDRIYDMLDF